VKQHEVTQAEWTALGLRNPSGRSPEWGGDCAEADCPVGNVSWFEAIAYANLLSEAHSPPLPLCYHLVGCTGKPGDGLHCQSASLAAPSLYECGGFRLPTEAEWEYGCRAGTRSAFYSGGFASASSEQEARDCNVEEAAVDAIAWYCNNSAAMTHPVGHKTSNPWGLSDMSGNAHEWTHDRYKGGGYGSGPLVDPEGQLEVHEVRVERGGGYNIWPSRLRSASHLMESWNTRSFGLGFRLARTGTENPGPIPGAPASSAASASAASVGSSEARRREPLGRATGARRTD
jgi:formylglycine-generating enzyme required for sulfatase activity